MANPFKNFLGLFEKSGQDQSESGDDDSVKPWTMMETSQTPADGGAVSLHRRGKEYSIRIDGQELMNSRRHGSEEELARLACQAVADRADCRVLIGGLGMGYTLAAALKHLDSTGTAVVVELIPAVVRWNQNYIGHLADKPLEDERAAVIQGDVAQTIQKSRQAFDAILLDVDNGPEGLTQKENDRLYQPEGLEDARKALRPGGVLAVWSAAKDSSFSKRLKAAGFQVDVHKVRAHLGKGSRHFIWIAKKK